MPVNLLAKPNLTSSRCPRRTTIGVANCLALALLAGACGSDATNESGTDTGSTESTTAVADSATAQAAERVAGRYAHFDVVAYEGDAMKTLIISYGFTDLDLEDGRLMATESFCFSEHRSDQPISVQMPDTATQAIRPVPIEASVTLEDGRAVIDRPETPTGIGVRLDDPANDPLPRDPNDPRIADDDGDGKPGVTARITVSPEFGGEIYLARREIFAYEVTEQPDRSLTGSVRDRSEQLVIGASDDVFFTQAQWTQHPDPAKSPIILRPVERSWDCERLRAERDALFPPTPAVDW